MRNAVNIAIVILTGIISTACVHEWPDNPRPLRTVTLHVHHNLEWSETLHHDATRSDAGCVPRYHIIVTPRNKTEVAHEFEHFTFDTGRSDFTHTIHLPAGDYDLYVWHDWAHPVTSQSLFFDSSDFGSIWYPDPYQGHNELRDAMRGNTSFTVENTLAAEYSIDVNLDLERPLAKYRFISTDFDEFIDREASKISSRETTDGEAAKSMPDPGDYKVKMIYTGYMPHKFNNFLNRPVDSATGMSYTASISKLSDTEAQLGFDYVMVNGHESSIPVAMEIYDPEGGIIARSNPINVPTKRNRETVVRGQFLTSTASGGVTINPDFSGDYNYEIR